MSQYASLTVAQLKDALKEKNLSTDGKKADLVARLDEASTATGEEEATKEENTEAQKTEDGDVSTETGAESAAVEKEAGETNGAEAEKPEKKVLSPEERKALAVDLLTKKIKRAEKFGDEPGATAAKKDLARVEKFGVDPSTALGKEIGALGNDVNSELATRRPRKNNKKGKVQKK